MPDAIPTPEDKQPKMQTNIVVQAPMTQWTALKAAGWWVSYDWVMLGVIGVIFVTGIYWKIFGDPGAEGLIALLLATILILLVWIVSLVFRCSWFVLRLNADIATLPDQSARIAVAYLQGTPPPQRK
jgi:uncharacterized PurR-regulated membrane protein YhhQ (DUF165 family)